MTLVLAYERQIGGRGTEIKPGDPVPPVPDKKPLIAHPEPVPVPPPAPGAESTAAQASPPPANEKKAGEKAVDEKKAGEKKADDAPPKKPRHVRKKRRRKHTAGD